MTTTQSNQVVASAVYENTVTHEEYQLGLFLNAGDTPLSAAWNRGVKVASVVNGWRLVDIRVKSTTPFCGCCGRVMPADEVGDELPEERVCDGCVTK